MSVLDNFKTVLKLVQESDNIELRQKILALQTDVENLTQENANLKQQVGALTEQLQSHGSLHIRDSAYWDESENGPYCITCWDSKKQRMLMFGTEVYRCHTCEHDYPTEAFRAQLAREMEFYSNS